jgi:hypothetical protein
VAAVGIRTTMRMELPLLLIIIGIVLAVLVHYALGIVCILIGLVLLLWPRIAGSSHTTATR